MSSTLIESPTKNESQNLSPFKYKNESTEGGKIGMHHDNTSSANTRTTTENISNLINNNHIVTRSVLHIEPLHRSIFKNKKSYIGNNSTKLHSNHIEKKITDEVKSHRQSLTLKRNLLNKYCSPTDTLLSPCSKKLINYKLKSSQSKPSKATKLSFQAKKNPSVYTDDEDLMED